MRVRVIATACVVVGALSLVIGAALVYPPAGFIVAGSLLLAAGVDAMRPARGDRT